MLHSSHKLKSLTLIVSITLISLSLCPKAQSNDANLNFGEPIDWYGCEENPKMFCGLFQIHENGYTFTVKANHSMEKKVFTVAFYDEDAEKEAIEIVQSNQLDAHGNNIKLIGYHCQTQKDKLEVIGGEMVNTATPRIN
jgi:hypothetical protein